MGEIRIEQRGRVLLGTLDNPPHGLLDVGTVEALDSLVARADSDPRIGGVVLTGAHPDRFAAHYDVAELLEGARSAPSLGRRAASASLRAVAALRRLPGADERLARSPAAGAMRLERFHSILLRMNRSGAVWVAALNGSAMGGACELALGCDFRIMADGDHGIGQPEILFAFPPGGGGTQRLARMLGTTRALRLVLDGGPLPPVAAAEIGLVDEVVAAEEVLPRAVALAERLGSRTKHAVAACKRAVYEGGSLSLAAGLHVERAEFAAAFGTQEAQELMAAYVARSERTGELPAYDPEAMERTLQSGGFREG